MKFSKICLAFISLLLLCSMSLNLIGCSTAIKATDLMTGVTPQRVTELDDLSVGNACATDFALRLFQAANENGKNTLISPLSVMCALAMTANGAGGQTREQMEQMLGMSVEELNHYIYSYVSSLPQGDKYKLKLANSIWFTDDARLTVKQGFLQSVADYYGADIYKTPFNDQALKDINNWVKNKTDGMIPEILDKIPERVIMYLVNALIFDAEWTEFYEKDQVRDKTFTKEDGIRQDAELMYCTEGKYLEDEKATGFIKYYKGYKYAFVALLPNEGVTVSEYIDSLDGASLTALLKNAESKTVYTAIPKFETEYKTEMSDILKSMGMTEAFDEDHANFQGVGDWSQGNIYVSNVLHKTHIQLGEKGTKAGAVTAIALDGNTSAAPGEIKEVYLDRPFVYMLIDCENSIPFFIGTMMDIDK